MHQRFHVLLAEAKRIALDAVKFAEESTEPPLEKLYNYTYVDGAVKAATSLQKNKSPEEEKAAAAT